MRLQENARTALIGATLALLLAGGAAERADGIAQAASQETLSLCTGGAPGIFPLLTHARGHFAAEGVAVEVKRFATTTEGLERFFRGECDLSSISETAVVMKSLERRDFSILATYATSDDTAVVLASRKGGIAAPRDLRGKRILVPRWSSNHFFLVMYLARHGMTERDVTLTFSGLSDVPAAFDSGRIDAYCASEVAVDAARRALGSDAVVLSAPGLCLSSYHLVAGNGFIRSRPQAVKKVLAALLRTDEWINRSSASAIKAAALLQNMEVPAMARMWEKHRWKVELSQTLLMALEQEALWAINAGYAGRTSIPNYLDYVHRQGLLELKPEAVTILP